MTEDLKAQFAKALESIDAMAQENRRLKDENQEIDRENISYRAEIDHLRSALVEAEAKRDHYMRYAIEFATQMTGIKEVIESCERKVRRVAYQEKEEPTSIDPRLGLLADKITSGQIN